jgi:glutamate carboxypeptidase
MNRSTTAQARAGAAMLAFTLLGFAAGAMGAAMEPIWSLVQKEKQPLIESLQALTAIESGSSDRPGLDKIADLIAQRLTALGGKIEFIEAGDDIYKMFDTPTKIGKMVKATFIGTGKTRILLLAHMSTSRA